MEGRRQAVLDASAVIALMLGENGEDAIRAISEGSSMSTVNWTEVLQIVAAAGYSTGERTSQIQARA